MRREVQLGDQVTGRLLGYESKNDRNRKSVSDPTAFAAMNTL